VKNERVTIGVDRIARAAHKRLKSQQQFGFPNGLLEDKSRATGIISFEHHRRDVAAKIAIQALVGHVKPAGNVGRQSSLKRRVAHGAAFRVAGSDLLSFVFKSSGCPHRKTENEPRFLTDPPA